MFWIGEFVVRGCPIWLKLQQWRQYWECPSENCEIVIFEFRLEYSNLKFEYELEYSNLELEYELEYSNSNIAISRFSDGRSQCFFNLDIGCLSVCDYLLRHPKINSIRHIYLVYSTSCSQLAFLTQILCCSAAGDQKGNK